MKRHRRIHPHHKLIQHLHIHQRQSALEIRGQHLIRTARFGFAGGVIMGKNDRRRVQCQRMFDDFSRVNAGLHQRS